MMGQTPLMGSQAIAAEDIRALLRRQHYDLALSGNAAQFAALRTIAPVTQFLYGSDFPFAPEAAVMAAESDFANLPMSDSERFAIRRGNALRLFGRLSSDAG